VARANFAAALALGRLGAIAKHPDLAAVAARHGRKDATEALGWFGEILNGRKVDKTLASALWQSAAGTGSDPERLNRAVALLLARPESQLN
jgi:hypothetical protein